MTVESSIDIFTGSSTGAFKGVNLATSSFSNLSPISTLSPKADEIVGLDWAGPSQVDVLAARLDRSLGLFEGQSMAFRPLFSADGGEGRIRGLQSFGDGRVLTGVESGLVTTWTAEGDAAGRLESGAGLHALRISPANSGCVATGGRESFLRLWDLERAGTPTFSAKNVKADFLQLRRPVWVRGIRFFPDSERVATVTGHAQVRVYDPRAQRRPVSEVEWLDAPFSALDVPAAESHLLVAGNSKGNMALFDLRGKAKLAHVFKGFSGSIRGIVAHPTAPIVASCAADRFLRIHHLHTKQLLHKVYCKTPLNAMLMRDALSILDSEGRIVLVPQKAPEVGVKKEEDVDGAGSSGDEVWEEMGTVGDRKGLAKRAREATGPASPERKRARPPPVLKRTSQRPESPSHKKPRTQQPESPKRESKRRKIQAKE